MKTTRIILDESTGEIFTEKKRFDVATQKWYWERIPAMKFDDEEKRLLEKLMKDL